MMSNNLKTIFYHALWYFLIVSVFFFDNMRAIFNGLVPENSTQVLVLGGATVVFSTIFAILFLRGQGSFIENFNSIASLVVMNILLGLGVAVGVLFNRFDLASAGVALLLFLLQIILVMAVLTGKRRA